MILRKVYKRRMVAADEYRKDPTVMPGMVTSLIPLYWKPGVKTIFPRLNFVNFLENAEFSGLAGGRYIPPVRLAPAPPFRQGGHCPLRAEHDQLTIIEVAVTAGAMNCGMVATGNH